MYVILAWNEMWWNTVYFGVLWSHVGWTLFVHDINIKSNQLKSLLYIKLLNSSFTLNIHSRKIQQTHECCSNINSKISDLIVKYWQGTLYCTIIAYTFTWNFI